MLGRCTLWHKSVLNSFGVLIMALLVLSACGGGGTGTTNTTPQPTTPIKIGMSLSLSGDFRDINSGPIQSTKMAVY